MTKPTEMELMATPEVKVDSDRHPGMFKTLDLLKIKSLDGPIFFIVEGCAMFKGKPEDLDCMFLYEEHTCPTNFIRIEAIFTPDSDDPHGVFKWVRSVWMPKEYVAAKDGIGEPDEILRTLFPETRGDD